MATNLDLAATTQDAGKLAGSATYRPKAAMPPLRKQRKFAEIRSILQVTRPETKDLTRLLVQSGLSSGEVLRAMPALLHSLALGDLMISKTRMWISLCGYCAIIFAITMSEKFFDPTKGDVENIVLTLTFFLIVILNMVFVDPRNDYNKRKTKYRPVFISASMKTWLITGSAVGLVVVGIILKYSNLDFQFIFSQKMVVFIIAQAFLTLTYLWLMFALTKRILSWRAPELVLVRALADAFAMIADARPASWRSVSLRSKAARYLDKAADTLEGSIARGFVASAGLGGAAAIHERLRMAGTALRSKVAWLATPKVETQEFLARALAGQLLIAATGNLDRLECAKLEAADSPSVGWFTRLRATVSWAAFGFGPAIFVIVSKSAGWVTDPATTGILVQFAALCFFVAVLSATDPTGYKDRLSGVTSTGAALFGWRKAS